MRLANADASIPTWLPHMLAREAPALPQGEDWVYEFCWGGERVRALKRDGGVRLLGRDGRDLANRFPRAAAAVARLRVASALLDGEILLLDRLSPAAVSFLARACDDLGQSRVAFLAFDLLWFDGVDTRGWPLLARRVKLASLVQATPIIFSPLIRGQRPSPLAPAAELGLPGVVAKRGAAAYRPNSVAQDWLRVAGAVPQLQAASSAEMRAGSGNFWK